MRLIILILIATGLYYLSSAIAPPPSAPPATPQRAERQRADCSPGASRERRALIQKLIRDGVFYKHVEMSGLPDIAVGPDFYALDYDGKSAAVSIISAESYCSTDNKLGIVELHDWQTGKNVGDFSVLSGLSMK